MKKSITLFISALLAVSISVKAADVMVSPSDNLKEKIEAASAGDVFILADGEYKGSEADYGNIAVKTSFTVKALNPLKAKVIGASWVFNVSNSGDVKIEGIVFDGTKLFPGSDADTLQLYFMDFAANTTTFNNITVENCTVVNYGNCFLRANRTDNATCESLIVNNCVMSHFGYMNLYPFFQLTKTKIAKLELTNSTLSNTAVEFYQGYGTAGTNSESEILFKNNTFYNVVTNSARTPFGGKLGDYYLKNCILVKSPVHGSKELNFDASVTVKVAENNVMFDFADGALATAAAWSSITGTITNDPEFADPDNGDFTLPVGSPLIAAQIGDPRWFPTGTSTGNIDASKEVAAVEYYDLTGRVISNYVDGFAIEKEIYTDGSVSAKKVYKK